jgi:hypothetical protein
VAAHLRPHITCKFTSAHPRNCTCKGGAMFWSGKTCNGEKMLWRAFGGGSFHFLRLRKPALRPVGRKKELFLSVGKAHSSILWRKHSRAFCSSLVTSLIVSCILCLPLVKCLPFPIAQLGICVSCALLYAEQLLWSLLACLSFGAHFLESGVFLGASFLGFYL